MSVSKLARHHQLKIKREIFKTISAEEEEEELYKNPCEIRRQKKPKLRVPLYFYNKSIGNSLFQYFTVYFVILIIPYT